MEFMNLEELPVKGTITCPICKKEKIIAYEGSSGKSSLHCCKCQRLILVNYDNLTACNAKPRSNKSRI